MNKKEYVGIYINDQTISGVKAKIKNNNLIVCDAYSDDRKGDTTSDLADFINKYSLESEEMGVVSSYAVKKYGMFTDLCDKESVKDMLDWHIEDFISWPINTYAFDFFLRYDTNCDENYLYIVAMQKSDITSLSNGLIKAKGHLSIIDYYPAPLTYPYEKRNGFVLGIVDDNQEKINLYAWWNGACINSLYVDLDENSLFEAVERLEVDLEKVGVDAISGINIYGMYQLDNEKSEACETLIEHYGALEPLKIEVMPMAKEKFNRGYLEWDMALGLTIRGLRYVDINR